VGARPHPPPPHPALLAERTLSDAEVHLLWARLDDWQDAGVERARRHLDEALRSDPTSVDVHFWRGRYFLARGDEAAAERELVPALQAKPREPRFLLTRLQLEGKMVDHGKPSHGELAALASRLAEVASTATELDTVARVRAWLTRPDDGLPFAERALAAEPNCWRCFDTYALLLSAKGRDDEAVTAQARALDLLPEGARDAPLLARLRKYKDAVRARTPPAPLLR
jgi:tetratricopeptide (TPR) repeat protein